MSSDLDWRKLIKEFTIYEAVGAILNIKKPDIENDCDCRSVARALLTSMIDGELPYTPVTKYVKRFVHDEMGGEYVNEPIGTDLIVSPISRKDFSAWCEKYNYRPSFLFPDATESKDHPLPRLEDDLADYHTPALDALRAAIRHFWLNHNPNHHPKREDIVKWLMEQHGMTQAMASSIDRIIRPEGRRKGGNSKRN